MQTYMKKTTLHSWKKWLPSKQLIWSVIVQTTFLYFPGETNRKNALRKCDSGPCTKVKRHGFSNHNIEEPSNSRSRGITRRRSFKFVNSLVKKFHKGVQQRNMFGNVPSNTSSGHNTASETAAHRLGKHQRKPGLAPAAQSESDLKDEERNIFKNVPHGTLSGHNTANETVAHRLGKHQHKPGLGPAAQIESDLKDEERSTNQRIGTLEKSKGSFRERAQKIVSLMEQSSRERNEDFESIEEIQLYFSLKESLKT